MLPRNIIPSPMSPSSWGHQRSMARSSPSCARMTISRSPAEMIARPPASRSAGRGTRIGGSSSATLGVPEAFEDRLALHRGHQPARRHGEAALEQQVIDGVGGLAGLDADLGEGLLVAALDGDAVLPVCL